MSQKSKTFLRLKVRLADLIQIGYKKAGKKG